MFSKRPDGRALKTIDPMFKLIPIIMKERSDSQNFYKQEFVTDIFDAYLREKHEQGIDMDYMTIVMTAFVRLLAQRPFLNRFIMNGRIYARNDIYLSFVIKKSLKDDSEETTIKLKFTGCETIAEVGEKVREAVRENKVQTNQNSTDAFMAKFFNMPHFLVKLIVGTIIKMDKHNIMPSSVIDLSPFHTSAFVTNIKSIKLNYIYHHLYNFGTTSIFVSLGKSTMRPVSGEGDTVENKKVFTLGFVLDERTCDGLYLANSLRLLEKYLNDPTLLEEPLSEKTEDIE